MSNELDLVREVKIARIFELLVSGEADSITRACEIVGVPRSTYYAWRKEGLFDEMLGQMKASIIAEVVSRFESAVPDVVAKLVRGAKNEDDKLSARDSDQNARTLLLYYDKLTGGVSQPATGESAADWLSRHAGKFQPIQIVGSTVTIKGADDPEVESEE